MSAVCTAPVPFVTAPARSVSLSVTSAIAFLVRLSGAGGVFLTHVLLIRNLGVAQYGEYALAVTWLQTLGALAKLGLDNTSLRYVAEYVTKGQMGYLRGFIRDSFRACLLASVFTMLGLIFTVWICRNMLGDGLANSLIVAAMMIPVLSIRQVQEASLRGVGRLFESQLSTVVWPFLLCALAFAVTNTQIVSLSSATATFLHFISFSIVAVMVAFFLRRVPLLQETNATYDFNRSLWSRTALMFLLAESLIALKSRACVALGGMILGSDSVGLYCAMERIGDVCVLGSQSLGLVIAPQFAILFAAGRHREMRQLMRYGQFLILACTVPVALAVVLFGDYVFLLLGTDDREGWNVLLALLASICIASLSGPGAYVLQMTGHEKSMLLITAASACANLLVGLLLMPYWGIMGLGLAQVATSLTWTIGIWLSLRKHPVWAGPDGSQISTARIFTDEAMP